MSFPKIVFVGAHVEAEAPLRFLLDTRENVAGVVTLPAARRSAMSGGFDAGRIAADAGIPVLEQSDINGEEAIAWISGLRPDVLLVIGWTQLLKPPVLGLASVATLGFHASLLPKYRGRAPINWALINGETETGNTLMVLDPGADEGDIVAQRRIPIDFEDTCATLYGKVGETEVDMLAEVLPLIRAGRLPRVRQDSSQATTMPKRRPADGVIDWSRSARDLYNWVRALTHPYPGAFSCWNDLPVYIWSARISDENPGAGEPGLIAADREGWPIAATGDGWLRLVRVQCGEQPEMEGREAVVTFLQPGVRLGCPSGAAQ